MRRFFLNLAKAPVLYAAIVGFLAALWLAPRAVVMPGRRCGSIGTGTFVLVGIAGLSVIDRYLLVPTLMVMVFAALRPGRLDDAAAGPAGAARSGRSRRSR